MQIPPNETKCQICRIFLRKPVDFFKKYNHASLVVSILKYILVNKRFFSRNEDNFFETINFIQK